MSLTCDRCLDGRHRCLSPDCACTCRADRRRAPTTGGVLRTPRPGVTKARPRPRPKAQEVPGRPGRPRVWANDRERRRESARQKRGTYQRVSAELLADPSGKTWSYWTRRIFNAEVERLGGTP